MNLVDKSKNNGRPPRQRRDLLLTAASAAALLSIAPLSAVRAEVVNPPAMLLSDVAPVSDTELAQNRGGFSIGNLNLDIHVVVSGALDGANGQSASFTTTFAINQPGQLTNLGTQVSGDVAKQVSDTLADVGIVSGSNNSSGKSSDQVVADNTPINPVGQSGTQSASSSDPISDSSGGGLPTTDSTSLSSSSSQLGTTNVQTGSTDQSSNSSQLGASNVQTSSTDQSPSNSQPNTSNVQTGSTGQSSGNSQLGSANAQTAGVQPSASQTGFALYVDPATNSIHFTNNAGTDISISTAQGLLTTIKNSLDNIGVATRIDLNFGINDSNNLIANMQSAQQAMNIAQEMLAIRGITGH